MEEVSGVTFEESFQDLPIELERYYFSFISVMSLMISLMNRQELMRF